MYVFRSTKSPKYTNPNIQTSINVPKNLKMYLTFIFKPCLKHFITTYKHFFFLSHITYYRNRTAKPVLTNYSQTTRDSCICRWCDFYIFAYSQHYYQTNNRIHHGPLEVSKTSTFGRFAGKRVFYSAHTLHAWFQQQ